MDAFRYLLGLVLSAFIMGAVFDVYNTVTGSSKWLRWLRPLFDVLFWLLSAGLVYYAAFVTNQGQLRIYTFVLLILGYGLYRLLAHRLVVSGAYGVVRFVRAATTFLWKTVYLVLVQPIRFLLRVVWFCLTHLYRLGRVLEDVLCRIIAIVWRIVFFPVRRWLPAQADWTLSIQTRWEDFWTWLSNRISSNAQRV